jgi:hypothetical protein
MLPYLKPLWSPSFTLTDTAEHTHSSQLLLSYFWKPVEWQNKDGAGSTFIQSMHLHSKTRKETKITTLSALLYADS